MSMIVYTKAMKSFIKIVAAIVVGIGISILGMLTMCSVAYEGGEIEE